MLAGMQIPDWTAQAAELAHTYAQPILFGVGATGSLLGALLVWRFFRTGHAHTRVGFLAVVLATAFAAEGMWEVATGPMGLPPLMAAGLFGMFEVVMVAQGLLAKFKLAQNPPGDVRRHMNFVWAVAAASGMVASTASSSVPEFLLRLCAPAVGAGIWWMGITADKPAGVVQPTSWIWTPRRIGIHLGLIQPGQQDLVQVDRDRRIDAITVTAHRLHHGSKRLAGWRKSKLRRLALQADDAMVAEAQRRVARVHRIEKLTSPDAAPVDEVTDREQATLDDVRLIMRQATERIRADHSRAFGTDQPWSNGMVQMRSSLADQIRSTPPVQPRTTPVDQPRTSGVVQDRSNPDRPVQPVTSTSLAAERTGPARQATVRVERARPISPAAGGEIPPRVQTMVRDLKRKYRGDIPGRRVVMPAMGWTNAGDAQTAINLVRAERADK